jgi:hypothetical protein
MRSQPLSAPAWAVGRSGPLLIRSCRRDSFLLAFDSPAPAGAMPATAR